MSNATILSAVIVAAFMQGKSLHASESLASEVVKQAQAGQSAIQAKNPSNAYDSTLAFIRASKLQPAESALLHRVLLAAALEMKSPEKAISALEELASNPSVSSTDKLGFLELLAVQQATSGKDDLASKTAIRYSKAGGKNPGLVAFAIQALADQKSKEALSLANEAMAARPGEGANGPPEAILKAVAYARLEFKDELGYYEAMTKLLAVAPKAEVWSDLLNVLGRSSLVTERLQLDVSRLMVHARVATVQDEIDMAKFAMKIGQPGEALRALARASVEAKAGQLAEIRRIEASAKPRHQEDQQMAARAKAKALSLGEARQLAEYYFGEGDYAASSPLFTQALSDTQHPRRSETLLHAGIAELKLGKADQAKAMFDLLPAQSPELRLARLWLLQLK